MPQPSTSAAPILRVVVWTILGLLLAAVLLIVGLRWGAQLISDPLGTALQGDLDEIHVTDGNVFVGHVVEVGGNEILLEDAALIRRTDTTGTDTTGATDGSFVVQLLIGDPFDLTGSVAIERSQIVLIGAVDPSSALAGAYVRARSGNTPSASPGQ